MERKTPLFDAHVALGGRMVPFAGYMMPVQYKTGIIAEHKAVREKAGLFDVSHMGELHLSGKDALASLQNIVTRDISGMVPGQAAYSPVCNENGGVVDDILVYMLEENNYILVVNASNRFKDADWVRTHLQGDVCFEDISDATGQIALQGPLSEKILRKLTCEIPEKYYTFIDNVDIEGKKVVVSRTGYTGEDGFEIYADSNVIAELWDSLLRVGEEDGLIPCGLGARDTLRLEAAMPLYGNEMDDEVLPFEAGIGFFVHTDKKNFIGSDALAEKKADACIRRGLEILGRSIARHGDEVYCNGKKAGVVTSGSMSPTLGKAICMARIARDFSQEEFFTVVVRGKEIEAKRTPLPFYKREK